jgi:hypothetical protein
LYQLTKTTEIKLQTKYCKQKGKFFAFEKLSTTVMQRGAPRVAVVGECVNDTKEPEVGGRW